MTHMQIDGSPSPRPLRSKRARSQSSSPSPCEHPNKRHSYAKSDAIVLAGIASTTFTVAQSTRHVADDWVSKTRGLRLKSQSPYISEDEAHPANTAVRRVPSPSSSVGILSLGRMPSDHDVTMVRHSFADCPTLSRTGLQTSDTESPPRQTHTPRPDPATPTGRRRGFDIPQLVIPTHPQTSSSSTVYHPHPFQPAPPPPPIALPAAPQANLHLPHIRVQPATPSTETSSADSSAAPSPYQQPSADAGVSMAWVPTAPSTDTLVTGTGALLLSPRKPRVSMGPRADCDKCRLGVKGHWMHFD